MKGGVDNLKNKELYVVILYTSFGYLDNNIQLCFKDLESTMVHSQCTMVHSQCTMVHLQCTFFYEND